MLHQHSDREPDRIGLTGSDPCPDVREQFPGFLFKCFWGKLVTCSPIINIRQKSVNFRHAAVKIFLQRNHKSMQLIFIEILMRQAGEKSICISFFVQALCESAQCRCSDAYNSAGSYSWNDFCLQKSIVLIPHPEQLRYDLISVHFRLSCPRSSTIDPFRPLHHHSGIPSGRISHIKFTTIGAAYVKNPDRGRRRTPLPFPIRI